MLADRATIACPNCGHIWSLAAPGEEVQCPVCAWEFATDETGQVTDDGGLDAEGPCTIDAEGELTAETLWPADCPACGRRFDVSEPEEVARCPRCRRRFQVCAQPPRAERWPGEGDEDICDDEYNSILCPCCADHGDYDGPAFAPLVDGWVACEGCGWAFHNADLFAELREEECSWPEERGCCVVAQDGTGDCRFLSHAENQVGGRGQLLVRPGVYADEAQFHVPRLLIQGDGPAESIILKGGLVCGGERMVVRGVTVTGPLDVRHGRVTLEDCILRGAKEVALCIGGWGTDVLLRRCRLENGRGTGVWVTSGARARLFDCTVSGNAHEGIAIDGGAWLRLQDCRLHENGGDGLRVRDHGSAFLHRCVVTDNRGRGFALEGGRAVLTRCQFVGQGRAGIVAGWRARLIVRRCEIRDGNSAGIRLGRQTRTLLTNSTVAGNDAAGLVIDACGRAVLRGCRIEANRAAGVRLAAWASVTLRDSVCLGNAPADWNVVPGGRVCIASNRPTN